MQPSYRRGSVFHATKLKAGGGVIPAKLTTVFQDVNVEANSNDIIVMISVPAIHI